MSADSDRQNALLCLAYQSKLMALAGIGGPRRVVNTFADGFTTATGINPAQSSNYIFDNIVGVIAPIPGYGPNLSTQAAAIAGVAAAISGSAGQTSDGNTSPSLNGWVSGETSGAVIDVSYVGQNFGGTPRHIRQMMLWQGYNGDVDKYVPSVLAQYSDNGSSWITLTTFTLPYTLAPQPLALPASAPHQYWRLVANAAPGASNRWGVTELQMMEASGGANMTLVTVAQPTDAAVSNGRLLFEIDNAAGLTWNADITAEVTCDGVNWAPTTLFLVSADSQGGHAVVESNDQPCVAGSSFAARIKTLTSKSAPIYALTVTAH